MRAILSFLTAAILVLLVTACATVSPVVVERERLWQSHRTALVDLTNWQTSGRVGVITANEGWSASFDWRQQQADYWIRISGPFGRSLVELVGKPRYVRLKEGGKKALVAQSADVLLEQRTGWTLPVDGLRYWIVGLPVPGFPEQHTVDSQGNLSSLNQAGWLIEYKSYQQVDGYRLPRKLQMVNGDVRVKLIASDWQVTP